MNFSPDDHVFMARALQLARRGLYTTTPNPRVGCVIVRDGRILGEGWHETAGQAHAEAMALASVRKVGAGETVGATAYVTLEPCSHFGRTPPCADALIEAGVARVVAAMQDPNPLVAGRGVRRLQDAGIQVDCGLLEAEARELNIGFVARMTRARPWLRLKAAISLDGKLALRNGVSQWITGPDARRDANAWRARSCAILTGSGTVNSDNPSLTVREVATPRQPLKVVVDSRLETPLDANILKTGPVLIATADDACARAAALRAHGAEILAAPNGRGGVDLRALLQKLGERGVNEVLTEAGGRLNAALLHADLIDELLIYQAPLVMGDAAQGLFGGVELATLTTAPRLEIVERRMVGCDQRLRARLVRA
ncbi:MAG TPA: bifunctional diaminohydroxyphosphoribosylaminopyrimidine deaminase/5-amino-6-(5-phosphoribosylamino)uracil reductase RibD [Rhodocyclaceae bacterium]|nr:bifunctional diaminohydroxyphosphoribosylaminopyrimidine deaminase/5-amino-6-(5-phosphoribosylamino)uracil reductase RibD [Rhodocyclaceae bacterium]